MKAHITRTLVYAILQTCQTEANIKMLRCGWQGWRRRCLTSNCPASNRPGKNATLTTILPTLLKLESNCQWNRVHFAYCNDCTYLTSRKKTEEMLIFHDVCYRLLLLRPEPDLNLPFQFFHCNFYTSQNIRKKIEARKYVKLQMIASKAWAGSRFSSNLHKILPLKLSLISDSNNFAMKIWPGCFCRSENFTVSMVSQCSFPLSLQWYECDENVL